MELIDLQCSERSKSKFLASDNLDFCENHVLLSGQFSYLITHTQQVVSMFSTTYCCEQYFFKMKHDKGTLRSQLPNHHLFDGILLSISSFNQDIMLVCMFKQMSHL